MPRRPLGKEITELERPEDLSGRVIYLVTPEVTFDFREWFAYADRADTFLFHYQEKRNDFLNGKRDGLRLVTFLLEFQLPSSLERSRS